MNSYLFDSAQDSERRRLGTLCELYDPGTQQVLSRIGPKLGWRCLEVAAGTGTIASWLTAAVGASGRVVATDIDTRFLEGLPGVEVRRHDIVNDPLEESSYDLIHARALLMHLPQRERALDSMLRALRPGGTLVIEDIILADSATWPELPGWRKVIDAGLAAFRAVGANPTLGIEYPAMLHRRGFDDSNFAVRAPIARGAPNREFYRLCLEALRPVYQKLGLLTEAEMAKALAALNAPDQVTLAPLMAAAWLTRV